MTIEEYDAYVTSRCKDYCDENYCIIALNGEAGEVAEWYKKFVLRGNITGKFAETDLQEELGDVLFYLTRLARLRGWSLSQVMDRNASKLDQRVANGMRIIC